MGNLTGEVYQFPDHVMLYRIIRNLTDCTGLQMDLDEIFGWCLDTGLEVNPTKSQHMRKSFKKNKIPIPIGSYKFAGTTIPTVKSVKCLGVVNSRMSWKPHVDEITRKAEQRLHFIKHLFLRPCGAVKQMLWKGIVVPLLEYCCTVHLIRH